MDTRKRLCEAKRERVRKGKNHPIEFKICIVSLSGGDSTEVTPVPIPNTVVKLCNADDTWWETARESK